MELRVVAVPEGVDPAELVLAEGAEAFTGLLDSAQSVPEFQVGRVLAEADLASPLGRDRALVAVRPIVAATPERSATRLELVRRVADRLSVPPDYVTASGASGGIDLPTRLSQAGIPRAAAALLGGESPAQRSGTAGRAVAPAFETAERTEREFLANCLAHEKLGAEYLHRLSDDHLSSPVICRVRDHFVSHFGDALSSLPTDDPVMGALVTDIVFLSEQQTASAATLWMTFLELEKRRVEKDLRRAAEGGDVPAKKRLWAEREQIRLRMGEDYGRAPEHRSTSLS